MKIFERIDTKYIPYEKTININNAPTDESIALFNELQDKAYKSIIATATINDNNLSFQSMICKERSNIVFGGHTMYYKFTLNGKEYTDKIGIDINVSDHREKIFETIFAILSKQIAKNILETVSKDILTVSFK